MIARYGEGVGGGSATPLVQMNAEGWSASSRGISKVLRSLVDFYLGKNGRSIKKKSPNVK